jgi:hypothetical protein
LDDFGIKGDRAVVEVTFLWMGRDPLEKPVEAPPAKTPTSVNAPSPDNEPPPADIPPPADEPSSNEDQNAGD